MRRPILYIALTAALAMAGCGSKGPLVLPPPPQASTPATAPAKPQTSAPRPAQTAPVQDDVSTLPTPTR